MKCINSFIFQYILTNYIIDGYYTYPHNICIIEDSFSNFLFSNKFRKVENKTEQERYIIPYFHIYNNNIYKCENKDLDIYFTFITNNNNMNNITLIYYAKKNKKIQYKNKPRYYNKKSRFHLKKSNKLRTHLRH